MNLQSLDKKQKEILDYMYKEWGKYREYQDYMEIKYGLDKIAELCMPHMDVYEFGVYGGNTLSTIIESYYHHYKPIRKVFAFDTFTGLPYTEDSFHEWTKGNFDARKLLHKSTPKEVVEELQHHFQQYNIELQFIVGLFKDTLVESEIRSQDMREASLIHIDCDLYQSTLEVLDMCFYYNIVTENTIIKYDDWVCKGLNEGTFGESKAHNEISDKYEVQWERLGDTIFKVKSYNANYW